MTTPEMSTVVDFLTALAIGALIGIEREKRKQEPGQTGTAGLRTFILFAEVGAIGGWLSRGLSSPWPLLVALAAVAVPVVAGYLVETRAQRAPFGLTTETAALVVVLLGGMTTLGHRELAIGLGIVTAGLLAYKQPLHGLLEKLGWDDVFAGLRLLVATFVILPLLPRTPIDPWGALEPRSLWLLVIMILGLSTVGYVAARWLGTGRGTLITGITGSLVSSTAVTLTFARRSHQERKPAATAQLIAGILAAWTVMFVRVPVMVAVVGPGLLTKLALPFAVMGAACALFSALALRRAAGTSSTAPDLALRNPFSLFAAVRFAALFAVVLLAMKLVELYAPVGSEYAVALLAGTTDMDAITLTMARGSATADPHVAATAIVLAAMSNTLVKGLLAVVLGGPGMRRTMLLATGVVLAAGAAVTWLP